MSATPNQQRNASRFDSFRFLSSWLRNPKNVGAVAPSGPALSRTMASMVDLSLEGPIVELGPGTGPVTAALLARGIPAERLVLIEYDRNFCSILTAKYPGLKVIEGDAFSLERTLGAHAAAPLAAIVSSLPLLNFSQDERERLIAAALRMLRPGAPFIQFTYGASSPLAVDSPLYQTASSRRVWWNLPPARVWTYRSR
jgi:phosphatidylethanolamine/phosphatidyl-N-methylethanolamine N-methyltransferase